MPLTPQQHAEFLTSIQHIINHFDGAFSSIDNKALDASLKLSEVIKNAEIKLKEMIETNNKSIQDLTGSLRGFDYFNNFPPSIDTNPLRETAIWVDYQNGDLYICIDNTTNANKWKSLSGKVISPNKEPMMSPLKNFTKIFFGGATYEYIFSEGFDIDENDEITFYEVFDIDNPLVKVLEPKVMAGNKHIFKIDFPTTNGIEKVSFKVRCYDKDLAFSEPILVELEINQGLARPMGTKGAGYGINHPYAKKHGLEPMEGCEDPNSPNFATYIDKIGSEFVCIPLQYYKQDANIKCPYSKIPRWYISNIKQEGFAPFLCFKDPTESEGYREAIFIGKYLTSNNSGVAMKNGTACSKKNHQPVDCSVYALANGYNSIDRLKYCGAVNNGWIGKIRDGSRSAGDNYTEVYGPTYFMMYILSLAHSQQILNDYEGKVELVPKGLCDWLSKYIHPLRPYGSNVNSYCQDLLDFYVYGPENEKPELERDTLGYSKTIINNILTGSAKNFSKTTLTGQEHGICDLVGGYYEATTSFLSNSKTSTNTGNYSSFYICPDLDKFQKYTTADFSGFKIYNALFGFKNIKDVGGDRVFTSGAIYGNGSGPLYSGDTDVNSDDYYLDNLGKPLLSGVTGGGSYATIIPTSPGFHDAFSYWLPTYPHPYYTIMVYTGCTFNSDYSGINANKTTTFTSSDANVSFRLQVHPIKK